MTRSGHITAALPVYAAALFQGLTLVSFPASSNALKQALGFTDAQYGAIFLPQVAAAILGALGGGALSGRYGLKTMFVLALLANVVSQALLSLSAAVPLGVAYLTILLGTTFLGLGFGMTGGPLNAYPRLLFPHKAGAALLVLHSTIGVGLSVGPLLVGWLSMRGAWLAFPVVLAVAGIVLAFCTTISCPLIARSPRNPKWIRVRPHTRNSGCWPRSQSSTPSPKARFPAGPSSTFASPGALRRPLRPARFRHSGRRWSSGASWLPACCCAFRRCSRALGPAAGHPVRVPVHSDHRDASRGDLRLRAGWVRVFRVLPADGGDRLRPVPRRGGVRLVDADRRFDVRIRALLRSSSAICAWRCRWNSSIACLRSIPRSCWG